jgi:hypothetical protein
MQFGLIAASDPGKRSRTAIPKNDHAVVTNDGGVNRPNIVRIGFKRSSRDHRWSAVETN